MVLLKKREYEKCPTCGVQTKLINDEMHGCDTCQKVVDLNEDSHNYGDTSHLRLTVFYHNSPDSSEHTKSFDFCSWECCFKFLHSIKNSLDIHFVSLPYLVWERDIKDKHCGDFFENIKN